MFNLKLLTTLIKLNVQQELAYRADALVNILVNIMWLGWELLSLSIIFSNTASLGGWGPGEMVTLLGMFRLVNTLMTALIWPNTERFNAGVRDGTLDYVLLMPVNSLFLISFSRIVFWRAWDLVLSGILLAVGISMTGTVTTLPSLLAFLLLAASGAVILYSLWIVLIAFTFWFVKFDNNVTILQALLDTGRYPAGVYPTWLRVIVTFVIPIAVATTIPVQALRGELAAWQIVMFLGVSVVSVFVASRVWKAGIQRYSGASS
jgi:ABC-2 type transport system permease protein